MITQLDKQATFPATPTYRILFICGLVLLAIIESMLGGCAHAPGTEFNDTGAQPRLNAPQKRLLPTIKVAKAIGWPANAKPVAATGFVVNAFASDLSHPRWLYVLPNGDVLVAETNAPALHDKGSGIKGWVKKKAMARTGAAVPSPNRITLLRDADNDGVAELRQTFVSELHSPFGMALVGDGFYVANTDAVVRYRYKSGDTKLTGAPQMIAKLPAGDINHHWTKNVLASRDGKKLYVTVGSNSNVAENGMANEEQRACILEISLDTKAVRIFASGLRNPNGLAWQPNTLALWTTVNERDELGDQLVPDYMTSVRDGGFYGWPYSYYGAHVDERVKPQRPELVRAAITPDYALGSHTASLGLAFYNAQSFPSRYTNGAFIGQHGSWNRSEFAGYRVAFVPFNAQGHPSGPIEDFLTGFLTHDNKAMGRPVGVAVDLTGALLVADDVGNRIWRVVPNISDKR